MVLGTERPCSGARLRKAIDQAEALQAAHSAPARKKRPIDVTLARSAAERVEAMQDEIVEVRS
jgi:hypothetical protein